MKNNINKKSKRRSFRKNGADLFNQLIALTGIPASKIRRELEEILERKNLDLHNLTVDQLRGVVAVYLRQIMGGLLDRYNGRRQNLHH